MKFRKNDILGILLAAFAGPGLFLIIISAYDLWDHRHTPLLGFLATNLAIGGALIGAFSRYIKNIYRFISLIFILLLCVFIVKILQWSGNEESNLKLLFIWIGLIDFLILNVIVGWEFLSNGFVPAMDRKNEKIPSPDIATEINEG
ncbi:MAG: hypothetical protein QMB22_02620 [Dehalococcoidia bacterium]|jgi:hypothetical protein|nr:MAG: hypothetical protein DK305_000256 [Chloroflexota bacterium]|tara:strand:+ start:76 stop:513 length:438 start_codon:yes stop_codon:yes gene_type:complete